MSTSNWISGRVTAMRRWTPTLFSVQFSAPGFAPFAAGQFVKVGLSVDGEIVGRPYSLVNSPDAPLLEIVVTEVAGGPLSPRLNQLSVGDEILVMPRANGFFSLTEVPSAQMLWCLATGTGLGPFLSMLRTPQPWTQFQRVALVHGVREGREHIYLDDIAAIASEHPDAFTFVPLVSRGANEVRAGNHLSGRMTDRLDDGALEFAAGGKLDADSHVMLCGNPQMLADMISRMEARGMKKHRRKEPGHYTTEAYW